MTRGLVLLGLVVVLASVAPIGAQSNIEETYAEHTRGVALARSGDHNAALAVLLPLLARFPNDYPLRRDVILINTWKGDCREALRQFEPLHRRTPLDDYLVAPIAECAVQVARSGDHHPAIEALAALLSHTADPYPLRRDLTLTTIWAGDCRRALTWFDPIRDDARTPPYLVEPVINCMRREGRRTEAYALVNSALARYPDDPELQIARTRIEIALRVDDNYGDDRPVTTFALAANDSDRGAREWLARTEVSTGIARSLRGYARYTLTRASEAAFRAGELNRAGAGLRWQPDFRWLLDGGVSTDVEQSGRTGLHARAEYRPYDTWRLGLVHDTYAEDISVRARANGIEATRTRASAQYAAVDYAWQWHGAVARYEYSDTNRRDELFASAGYALELAPWREQRIFAEWYQSHNSLQGAPYFNPSRDRSVGLVHRTDFVFDSRFKRHVDHLYVWIGSYNQQGFGAKSRWGIRYEQDYDFTGDGALVAGGGFYRNVYDGQREGEWRFDLTYQRRF